MRLVDCVAGQCPRCSRGERLVFHAGECRGPEYWDQLAADCVFTTTAVIFDLADYRAPVSGEGET